MPIPSFDRRGLLPPFKGADATTTDRSPYFCSMTELCTSLGTTSHRKSLLRKLIEYRELIGSDDYIEGLQFIDGSFVENIEILEARDPGDIDVFSLLSPPRKYLNGNSAWLSTGLPFWETEIVDNNKNKTRFSIDSYGIMIHPNQPASFLRNVLYWYSLFSHKRSNFDWKGFIVVPLDATNDSSGARRARSTIMATLLTLEALEADKLYVERQLAEADDDPWGTARIMWKSRLAEINSQIDRLSIRSSNYASVALIFDGNPVVGSSDIRLDFATDALTGFQRLVAARLAEKERQSTGDTTNLPRRGRLPGARNTKLFIRDMVRGSMGFVLEELAEQTELLPTKLKNAVENTTEFLGKLNTSSEEEFTQIVSLSEPRVIQATQKFTKILFEAGASARIAGDEQRLSLTIQDVDRLSKRLNEVEVSEEAEIVDGVLQGLLPEKLEFEFKVAGDDGITLRGDVADDLARKYTLDPAFVALLLHKPGRARIKVIRARRSGMLTKEQRIMEALEPGST